MVSRLVSGHYNAVIVQVLAYHDNAVGASHGAHWKSSIVPWSSRVTASFDPLSYLCQQAHAQGIEVHAWLGGSSAAMYRISTLWPPAGNSTLSAHPEWFIAPYTNSEENAVVAVDSVYALDMGSPDVQEYIVSIVRELVTNYSIDGINWDDEINGTGYTQGFGYPAYSQANYQRSGLARYRINTGASGTPVNTDTAWSNYRRRFKNELMARCQAEIQSIKTNPRQPLRHTSAALAYSPVPGSCDFTTSTPYLYFCDWASMLENGWVDAIVPQTYSSSTFNTWCDREVACWQYNRHIYPGIGAYLQTETTILSEMDYAYNTKGLKGCSTYSYGVPTAAGGVGSGWWSYVATNFYTNVVSTPTMPWRNPATATDGIMWGRVINAANTNYMDDATVTVAGGPTVKTDGNGYYVATMISATTNGTVHSTTASDPGSVSQTISSATVLAGDIVRYDFVLNFPPPSGLTATALSSNQISLSWLNNATNSAGIFIARGTTSGGPYTNVASVSAASTSYTNGGLTPSTTYYYVVRATNTLWASVNSAQASATTLAAGTPPGITTQPQSLTVTQGNNATFTISATGTAPLYYQWKFYTTNLPGATGSSFTRSNAQPVDAGPYSVLVSNSFGTSNSATGSLSVTVIPPFITQDPASRAAVPNGYAQFNVAAVGSNVVYQWQLNQTNLPGKTSSPLIISNVAQTDFGPYRAVATNSGGSATSAVAQLTLAANPTILGPLMTSNGFELHFNTEIGPVYAVEYKQALEDPWSELIRTNGTGSPVTMTSPGVTNPAQFYRLRLY